MTVRQKQAASVAASAARQHARCCAHALRTTARAAAARLHARAVALCVTAVRLRLQLLDRKTQQMVMVSSADTVSARAQQHAQVFAVRHAMCSTATTTASHCACVHNPPSSATTSASPTTRVESCVAVASTAAWRSGSSNWHSSGSVGWQAVQSNLLAEHSSAACSATRLTVCRTTGPPNSAQMAAPASACTGRPSSPTVPCQVAAAGPRVVLVST